tara:strand:- start:44205 stop:44714 length:510 start_codon:yes stop_codon:yes gene_type:complete
MEAFRVLVLNQSYEPINVCGAKRAIKMSLLGKAEVVESGEFEIRSETSQLFLPSVIRLKKYVYLKIRKKKVPFSKKNVLKRDQFTCQYCGSSNGEMTLDHIFPRSKGGKSTWKNVVCSCRVCNAKKGNRLPEEVGMILISKPTQPVFPLIGGFGKSSVIFSTEKWTKYF